MDIQIAISRGLAPNSPFYHLFADTMFQSRYANIDEASIVEVVNESAESVSIAIAGVILDSYGLT